MKTQTQPAQYNPARPADFIGPAHKAAKLLTAKSAALLAAGRGTVKLLLYGPPGVGKTRLAEMFAGQLAGHATQIESCNGRNVDLSLVRRWQESARYLPLHGQFSVKIVNELDTCPPASQDLLLTYLDEMPDNTAFIGTSNLDLRQLVERFQTRLQQVQVKAPETKELTGLLARWKLREQIVNQIAVGSGGNVRAALLDAQTVLDAQLA